MSDTDKEVLHVGKLRAITAAARAVDRVEVWVYLPNTRGPVRCYIAGHAMKPPEAGASNVLYLQIRPMPEDESPPPEDNDGGDIPTPGPPTVEPPDRGSAGRRTESVPNSDSPV